MGKKIIQKELFLFAWTQIILDSHYKGGTDFIPAGSLFGIQFGAIGTTCVKPFMIKVVMGLVMVIVLFSQWNSFPGINVVICGCAGKPSSGGTPLRCITGSRSQASGSSAQTQEAEIA
jgi:hypothetical protein